MNSLVFVLVSIVLFSAFSFYSGNLKYSSQSSSFKTNLEPKSVSKRDYNIKQTTQNLTTPTQKATQKPTEKPTQQPKPDPTNSKITLHFTPNSRTEPPNKFTLLNSRPELGFTYHSNANLINPYSRYAVIIANRLTKQSKLTYVFQIPFACLTWIQIGYRCFIVMPYFDDLELENPELKKANSMI